MNDLPKNAVWRIHEMLVSLFNHLGQPSTGDWHQGLIGRGLEVVWSKELISEISAKRNDRLVVPDPNPSNYNHDTEERSVLLVPHDTAFKMLVLGELS